MPTDGLSLIEKFGVIAIEVELSVTCFFFFFFFFISTVAVTVRSLILSSLTRNQLA